MVCAALFLGTVDFANYADFFFGEVLKDEFLDLMEKGTVKKVPDIFN